MTKRILMLATVAAITLSSCEKDDDNNNNNNPSTSYGSIAIELEHNWNGQAVTVPHTGHFNTNSGEHIMFSMFKYYLTNIELIDTEGEIWSENYSYHLLELGSNNTLILNIDSVPTGDYVGIRFTLGVDSARNVSGPQSGALDPLNEMFWSWNNGYIFFKAEGMEHMSSTSFRYHIGGFRDANNTNAIQELNFDFTPVVAEVTKDATPLLHYMVDVQQLFDGGSTSLTVANNPSVVMPGPMAVNISRNYRGMFELHHIHN